MPLKALVFFFFSSRRRHTRSLCDWSSDVCSSDLQIVIGPALVLGLAQGAYISRMSRSCLLRSEERRVGKECRSRWWRCRSKKKAVRVAGLSMIGVREVFSGEEHKAVL